MPRFEDKEVRISAWTNEEAVEQCDIAVLTVPFNAHAATLEGLKDLLQGKLLIDVCVPIVPPKVTKVQMPPEGSAALQAKQSWDLMYRLWTHSKRFLLNTCFRVKKLIVMFWLLAEIKKPVKL